VLSFPEAVSKLEEMGLGATSAKPKLVEIAGPLSAWSGPAPAAASAAGSAATSAATTPRTNAGSAAGTPRAGLGGLEELVQKTQQALLADDIHLHTLVHPYAHPLLTPLRTWATSSPRRRSRRRCCGGRPSASSTTSSRR